MAKDQNEEVEPEMQSDAGLKSILGKAMIAYSEGAFGVATTLCDNGLSHCRQHPELLHLRGLLYFRTGEMQNARNAIKEAITQEPNQAHFSNSLGVVLKESGQLSEAIGAYKDALSTKPNYAEALNNLGDAYVEDGQLDLGESQFRRAIAFNRSYSDAHYNLGNLLKKMGRLEEAVSQFDRCLEIEDSHSGAHWNRSLALLSLGSYEEAWPGYEWRFRQPEFPPSRALPIILWQGEPLEGKRLLVHAEQGFGDTLQFLRLIRPLLGQADQVFLECPSRLMSLLGTFDERLVLVAKESELPEVDYHLPLMSLPQRLALCANAIPEPDGYLRVLPSWTEACNQKISLPETSGMRIGIQWQGDPTFSEDENRSVPLENWQPLWSVEDVKWVSIQQGYGVEQLSESQPILNAGAHLDKGADGFVETAALLKQLDLLITTDTALAHLAGALKVPTWLILGEHPDWRWGLEGERSAWYDSLLLFRQHEQGVWSDVFEKIQRSLRDLF